MRSEFLNGGKPQEIGLFGAVSVKATEEFEDKNVCGAPVTMVRDALSVREEYANRAAVAAVEGLELETRLTDVKHLAKIVGVALSDLQALEMGVDAALLIDMFGFKFEPVGVVGTELCNGGNLREGGRAG